MSLLRHILFFLTLIILMGICAASSPPSWISSGMKITDTPALSNYYSPFNTAPEKWEQFEGIGNNG